MFSRSLERILRDEPTWREPVENLVRILQEYAPEQAISPSLLAQRTHLDATLTVAILKALEDSGLGHLGLRVVDSESLEVQRFRSADDLPAFVEDEMGDRIDLTPENVLVYFARAAS